MNNLIDDTVSARMKAIRSKDTKPELIVRRLVHGLGFRFRLHRKDLPGTPDLVFPSRRKIVFVHGCFWHRHPGCKRATLPKSRSEYWLKRPNRNIDRDVTNIAQLRSMDWDTIVVWECELVAKNLSKLESNLTRFL